MLIQATGIIGDIKRQPAAVEPDFRPGVHRHMLSVIAVNIAADVARRDLQCAAAGQKNMGMILAHSLRAGEGVGGGVLHLGRAGGVWHS